MGLLVIVGSVSVGIQVSQSQASSAADAHRLYQRVTSQTPTFLSPLTNPTMTQWDVDEKPTYGCKVNSDGLHVHVNDSHVFFYCTSGFGLFRTFAFQIKMKILSGEGGGLIFRADTTRGNFYYFHVYPNGWYRIYLSQKKKLTTELSEGTASSVVSGFGQENTLTVIAMGSRMDFYVNQTFLTEVVDPTYTNGSLAVLASTSTSPAEVVYTNAQIWEL